MKNPSRNKAAFLEFSLAQLVWAQAEGGKSFRNCVKVLVRGGADGQIVGSWRSR
jgi:hypothetical protein